MSKYGFFYNNIVFAIAESENEKIFLSDFISDSIVKPLTDEQFNNAKNFKSQLILDNEVVKENSMIAQPLNDSSIIEELARVQIKDFIKNALYKINGWLDANPTNDNFTYWNDYKSKLQEVDVDAMVFPLGFETFQEWFCNQTGHPQKSHLQLP
jgi:hypothetical protein